MKYVASFKADDTDRWFHAVTPNRADLEELEIKEPDDWKDL